MFTSFPFLYSKLKLIKQNGCKCHQSHTDALKLKCYKNTNPLNPSHALIFQAVCWRKLQLKQLRVMTAPQSHGFN